MDTGNPISYEVLEPGTPVYSSDGELIGSVAHVLAVPEEDVFDGIVIAAHLSPEGGGAEAPQDAVSGGRGAGRGGMADEHRFADADDVAAIHERGVTLKLDAAACWELPRPSENPAVLRDDPADAGSGRLGSKLRRAWDLISGHY